MIDQTIEKTENPTIENKELSLDDIWSTLKSDVIDQKDQNEITKNEVSEVESQPNIDYNKYIKEKFGYDNEEVAIAEINRLKESKAVELTFENETSKKIFDLLKEGKEDELYSVLEQKKKIDKLVNGDVTVSNAIEILQTNLKNQYGELTDKQVAHRINQQFNIPAKPIQKNDELDDEFQERIDKWREQKEVVEENLIIEATIAKKNLEKLRSEIKLPDIQRQADSSQPSQEELEKALSETRKVFETSLEKDFKSFSGFNVVAKNEEVELPLSFILTEEDKIELKNKLSSLDSSEYFGGRWFNQNGTPKIEQMMKDIYLLEKGDTIIQKIANESSNKTWEHLIKKNKNIHINGQQKGDITMPEKSESEQLASFFFGN